MFEIRIAVKAATPNCWKTAAVPQPQRVATITTGGAAKCVKAPPMDTLTKSKASVAYWRPEEGFRQ